MNKEFWNEKIKIGNLEVPRLMAAPLDGVTDSPLRQLIREFSPDDLLMTEMRHIAFVANEKTGKALKYNVSEQPLAFQFSANRLDFIEHSVERVIEAGFCMINLNCGCPSRCVTKSGSGSALMANIPLLKDILKEFHRVIKGRVPLTIKIRAGYKETNALELCKAIADCGIDCIMIHPRLQTGAFVAPLDFDLVKQIKEQTDVPIIFSGNVNSYRRAVKTYERTGVDGFMIGRALWGAPWKMREIYEESQGNEFSVDSQTALKYALKHFELNWKFYGVHGFRIFKKQLPQYIRSISGAAEWRKKLLVSTTEDEMREKLNQMCLENNVG